MLNKPMLLIAAVALAACDSSTDPRAPQAVAVAFSAVGSRTAVADTARVADSLVITKVQLVLSELELHRTAGDSLCVASTTAGATSGSRDDDKKKKEEEKKRKEEKRLRCPEIELGPFLVNLALAANPVSRFANSIPAGVYREIEFVISRPDNDSSGVAFVARNPDFRDISVRAEGLYKGKAFVYTGRAAAELELEFKPAITVENGTVINIRVDLAKWFKNAAGVAVDPATANPGGPNAALVARNIANSFSLLAS